MQPAGIYGIASSSNPKQALQTHMNRVIAIEHNSAGKGQNVGAGGQGGAQPSSGFKSSSIKEMMNTSAPICISSYIKGGQMAGRP